MVVTNILVILKFSPSVYISMFFLIQHRVYLTTRKSQPMRAFIPDPTVLCVSLFVVFFVLYLFLLYFSKFCITPENAMCIFRDSSPSINSLSCNLIWIIGSNFNIAQWILKPCEFFISLLLLAWFKDSFYHIGRRQWDKT